ncbi:hypothetical protein M9Y10_023659 [Tritrichomonas musculus]|uniref:F5/8 type C domain-containing protein n=1 Tax=Tritrichomonas musculus TaxID=1915356 RepID=A0ABR2KXL9_9EUKA
MHCDLGGTHQSGSFKVIIGDIKMKYPIYPILHYCPKWADQILKDKRLILDPTPNLNAVKDFFDGLNSNGVDITIDNCKTILELSTKAGSEKLAHNAESVYNDSQRTIPEIVTEYIQEKKDNKKDTHSTEVYLAKHYNELLKFPGLLKNIEISHHHKILQLAYNNDKEGFDFHSFLSFMIEMFENNCERKYSVLFSFFNFMDFEIDQIERLLNCQNFDQSYINHQGFNFLTTIKKNREELKIQNETIKQLQDNQLQINNDIKEIKELILNQQKTINEIDSIKQTLEETKGQTNHISELITQQQSSINEINSIKQTLEETKGQTNHISELITQQQSSINEINSIKQTLEETKGQTNHISELITQQQSSINEIKQQTQTIINNQNTNLTNLNASLNQKINSINSELKQEIQSSSQQMQSQLRQFSDLKESIRTQNDLCSEIKRQVPTEIQQIKTYMDEKHRVSDQKTESKINSQTQKIDQIKEELNRVKEKIEDYHLHNKLILRKEFNDEPFSGIFSTLTNTHKCNINDKGFIKISGNISGDNSFGSFSSLVDFNYTGNAYCSSENPNSFIRFDLRNYCISVSAYTLKSTKHGYPDYPKSWIVEGSNNESEWTQIDSQVNNSILCSNSKVHTFTISAQNVIEQPFRFVQIRLTGKSSRNAYCLEIANVEFFGKLFQL